MKRKILISGCVLLIIQGITAIIKMMNPYFLNIFYDSTAYHIGKIFGVIFKIALGAAGLIILVRNPDK